MIRTFRSSCVVALLAALAGSLAAPALAGEPGSTPVSAEDADVLRPIAAPPREPTPQMVRRSVELYNEGTEHARAGRLKAAYRAFRDAYEQDGSAESLANAAVIEAALGRPRSAAEHLAHAISRLPVDRTAERAALQKRLDEVAQQIGTVEITAPPVSRVELDGKWVGTGPFTRVFYVEPGGHDVLVEARGAAVRRPFQIKKGEKRAVMITEAELQASAAARVAAPAKAAAPEAPASTGRSPAPWIFGGAIVALAATGGAGLGVYLRAHDERVKIDEQTRALGGFCGRTPKPGFADDCRARDQEASNETIGTVLTIAGLGGAAALGTGILVAVLADSASTTTTARAPSRAWPRVAIGVGPAGFALQGSF
jgi:hypothetical protein